MLVKKANAAKELIMEEIAKEIKTEEPVAEEKFEELNAEEVGGQASAEVQTSEPAAEIKPEECATEEIGTTEIDKNEPEKTEQALEAPEKSEVEPKATQTTAGESEKNEKTEKPAKAEEKTKLDPTENAELLSHIATKRARKLIYAPKEAIYEVTGIKIDVEGKKNDKGVKVKDILDAEIKEGLKLGYLDKYDGLKTSEIKEEYENDTVWEIAEQEFKKMGLLLDGDKIKVYVFDWTGTGCHHVGYLPDDEAAKLMPYLTDMDKYSFDLDGIITGGKSKTVIKDEKTGKITVSKGKDGNYGIDLDVTVINRKD